MRELRIGLVGAGFGIAVARQEVRHTMGIVDIHLAAEGFDVKLAQAVTVALDFGNRLPEAVARDCGGSNPPSPRS